MRYVCLLLLSFTLSSCLRDIPVGFDNFSPSPEIEGTVTYFEGGGVVEMPLPPGYIVRDYQWVVQPSGVGGGPVYLVGRIDSSYIGRRVRAYGDVREETLVGSFPSYHTTILKMTVEVIQSLQ